MSGYTKYMYEKNINEIEKQFTLYIKDIFMVLPQTYDMDSIIMLLKEFYPFEYRVFEEKYDEYYIHDKKLIKLKGKTRFCMQSPKELLEDLSVTKRLLSEEYKKKYEKEFKIINLEKNRAILIKNRMPRIKKKQEKIDKAISKAQQMEPKFLDELMGLYERKNTSQKDRVYIMLELEKYYCPKVVQFFKKKAHSEFNFQLREMAVLHLHSIGHHAVLRKQKYMVMHTGNKKKRKFLKQEYAKANYKIQAIPNELEYRINNNSKEQRIKIFDYFISHCSKDYIEVQKLINHLNSMRKNVYCDWINDTDYLKRNLVCDSTLMVIRKRIEQAKSIVFVESDDSINSKWVKYELNYGKSLGKTIFYIKKDNMDNFEINKLDNNWFIDEDFEKAILY